MKNVKLILKLFIGVAALLLVMVVFSCTLRKGNLETDSLKAWRGASLDRRAAAVRMLTATDDDTELMVACVDKIATLPDSGEMAVRDAVSLCYTGAQIKQNQ
ncbi:MAG TPA: hypothetical protein DD611_01600 [Alphaproteobacteria bacterium]|nr:hypothetical protein [Alphaproteobacteria bacterium]HBS76719.1 hypothetical protein [Alphaproteobacteria bacterium]